MANIRKQKSNEGNPRVNRKPSSGTGQAQAGAADVARERRKGVATTPPRSKGKPNRDRSDNKKVQSGR